MSQLTNFASIDVVFLQISKGLGVEPAAQGTLVVGEFEHGVQEHHRAPSHFLLPDNRRFGAQLTRPACMRGRSRSPHRPTLWGATARSLLALRTTSDFSRKRRSGHRLLLAVYRGGRETRRSTRISTPAVERNGQAVVRDFVSKRVTGPTPTFSGVLESRNGACAFLGRRTCPPAHRLSGMWPP